MADHYVDLDGGSDANGGTGWSDAWLTMGKALTTETPAAGDRYFVKTDSAGSSTNRPASGITFDGGSVTQPIEIYGCKHGTTAEPPTNTDLIDSPSDADAPYFGCASDWAMNLNGSYYFYGIKLAIGWQNSWPNDTVDNVLIFENCQIIRISSTSTRFWRVGKAGLNTLLRLIDTEINLSNAAEDMAIQNAVFEWYGGSLSGTAPTVFFEAAGSDYGSRVFWAGLDISGMAGSSALLDQAAEGPIDILVANCKINASLSLVTGTLSGPNLRVRLHACSADTGKTTGQSILAYEEEWGVGSIEIETTAVRTGGANDGASGSFALAATTNANATNERFQPLRVQLMPIWIEGDGTSKTLTVYFAKSAAADWNNDQIALRIFAADDAGTAQFDMYYAGMAEPLSTPAAHTDDTTSTWGTGANNPQSMAASVSPDYEGYALCIVEIYKREASPTTVYIDAKPVVS